MTIAVQVIVNGSSKSGKLHGLYQSYSRCEKEEWMSNSLPDRKTLFTTSTDIASITRGVFHACLSQNHVWYSCRRVRCIIYKLLTLMKYSLKFKDVSYGLNARDFEVEVTNATLVKLFSLKSDVSIWIALIQEIETRFGTAFDVATRLNRSLLGTKSTLIEFGFNFAEIHITFTVWDHNVDRCSRCSLLG